MLLKLHAWLYRTFGYYSSYARRKEDEFISELKPESEFADGLLRGAWQAKHGFYRTSTQVSKSLAKRRKKWKR
jgi:hypothetical protein